jgi:poly-gamma-glutamate synthesis protein (capsule biosynthesis protein)
VCSSFVAVLVLACEAPEEARQVVDTVVPNEPSVHVTSAPPLAPTAAPRDTLVWIGGDVLDGEALRDFARTHDDPADGFAAAFEPAASLWRDDDAFVIVNLEVPVADERRFALDASLDATPTPGGRHRRVHLQGAPWMCEGLARAGVDAVVLANNHAMDQGPEGLRETIGCARRAGLAVLGAGVEPTRDWALSLGDPGREVAVHALYTGLDRGAIEVGDPERAFLDDTTLANVARSASTHDAVIAIVHVVAELEPEPDPAWASWATRLVDAGVDAIVVHGTHLPMRVERFGTRHIPIAWGLGNAMSDMGRLSGPRRQSSRKEEDAATREGLFARVRVRGPHDVELAVLPVFVLDDRFLRWHGALPRLHARDGSHADEIRFSLWPLDGCDEPARLPTEWREPWRAELVRWLRDRRDDVVRRSGLPATRCGEPAWLHLP